MSDEAAPNLHPATPEELAQALAFALRFKGRKTHTSAHEPMAWITAEHLVEHLRASGFVVMKKPPTPAHSAGDCRPAHMRHLTE